MRSGYGKESIKIIKYFITLRRLSRLLIKKFRKFKNYILKFVIRDRDLFRKANKNILLRRVINNTEN